MYPSTMNNYRQVPDYRLYTDADLHARAHSINRKLFTERAVLIDREIINRTPVIARRRERFAAAIIDALIFFIGMLPFIVMVKKGIISGHPLLLMTYSIGWSVAILLVVHGYTLAAFSQTIGKYYLGIHIEMIEGGQASLMTVVAGRYLPMFILTTIPFVGGFFGLINVVFIFRKDKRCLHDLIAGTRVCVSKSPHYE